MPRIYPASKTGSLSDHKLGDDFAASIEQFKIKTMEKAEEIIKAAIFDMYSEIIETSPVDSGLFRASNQIGIGTVPSGQPLGLPEQAPGKYPRKGTVNYDEGPSKTLAQSSLENYKTDKVTYICNNLSYAIPIEYGHSGQAPMGIYRKAALRFDSFLARQAAYRGNK